MNWILLSPFIFANLSSIVNNLALPQQFLMEHVLDGVLAFAFGAMACLVGFKAEHREMNPSPRLNPLFLGLLTAVGLEFVIDLASPSLVMGLQMGVKLVIAAIALLMTREFLAMSHATAQSQDPTLLAENPDVQQELEACRKLELELYKSEQRFNNAFDFALIGQATLAPNGDWIRVNPAFCNIVGYSKSELLEANFKEFTYLEDLDANQQHLDQLLSGEKNACRFEKRYLHKQGHVVWVLMSVSLVRSQDDQPLFFIAHIDNISEQKRAEENLNAMIDQLSLAVNERTSELEKAYDILKKSQAQYQDLYDNAPDMYLSVDASNAKILRCNRTLIDELGYTYEEVLGRTVIELYHPDFRSEAQKAFQCFTETGEVKDAYLVLQRKDGTTLDVSLNVQAFRDQQGKILYSRSSWRDISQRIRLENQLKQINTDLDEQVQNRTWALQIAVQSLKENQSRLELALEASGDGWWDWNVTTEEVNWSPQFFTMLGYEDGELRPSFDTWQHLIHPDDTARVLDILQAHLQDSANPYVFDYQVKTKSGQWKWIFAVGKVVSRDAQGQPLRMVGMHHDISDRKQAEKELRKINAELVRSNQDLEQFAYVASHDLQEPLRKIQSFIDLFASYYQGHLDERADRYIRYITDGSARLQGLIDDLLSYSRVGRAELKLQPTDLSTLVGQVQLDLEQIIAQRHVEITVEPLPTVTVDPIQLKRVFQNLIANAIKYCQADIPTIHIQARQKNGYWTIAVQDNGIGIDPQFAERIFVIFQRLHHREEYSGTGIGLTICRKIIERHGGQIWVDSEEGKGATFSFNLPFK